MVHSAFLSILWGMLIVAVDIRPSDGPLGGSDLLLPDVAGYVLIITALRRLSREGADFARAIPYASVDAVLSIPTTIGLDPGFVFTLSQIALDTITVWYLGAGIMRMAAERGNGDLVSVAENRRKLYCLAAFGSLTLSALRLVSADLAALLVIPVVVLGVTSALLFVLLVRRASLEIG